MAEVQPQPDGSFLLIENHCPICAAANACSKLCDAEFDVFQAILGKTAAIERTEHMLEGDRRCVYRIRTSS
jgi:predicted ArsR family transcriptional regulator